MSKHNSHGESNDFLDSKPYIPLYRDLNLYALFATVFALLQAITLITPALPQIATAFNIPPAQLGLLTSIYGLPVLVLDPVAGIVADRIGRKPLVIIALLIFGAACTACAFAHSFQELLVLRLIQGIGAAGIRSLPLAMAGDLYTGLRRTTVMGYFTGIAGVASILYRGIGGYLADKSWRYPFWLGIICLPIALFIWRTLKVKESRQTTPWRGHIQAALQTLKNQRLVVLYACSAMLSALNYGVFMVYFPLLAAERFSASGLQIGLLLAVSAISLILASTSTGWLARFRSELFLTQLGFSLCALGLLLIPLMPEFELLLIPVIVFAVGNGIAFPGVRTLLASLAPSQYLGTVMSANGSSFGIGQVLGPLLTGLMVGVSGIQGTFFIGTAMAIAAATYLAVYIKSNRAVEP